MTFNDALNTFYVWLYGTKEGNLLFNDAYNTFYIWRQTYGRGTDSERKEGMFYLTTHSTHFIYGVRHMVGEQTARGRKGMLFNDALNIFYIRFILLWAYGKGTDSERKEGENCVIKRRTQHILYTPIGVLEIYLQAKLPRVIQLQRS